MIGAGFATRGARAAESAGAAVRVALLIANGKYPDANMPSESPAMDADLLGSELTRYGFAVDVRKDIGRVDMLAALDALYARIKPGSTVLLYFNGIGIQVGRQTFLLPVNAQVWSEGDVKREGTNVDDVLAEIARRGARVKIAILDAARRNPFERRFRAYSAGLAGIDAPEGSLIVYAAAPNKTMQDAGSSVSLFMNELTKELRTPDINAEEAMTQTRIGVSRASNGEEVPWVASSLTEPFYFGRVPSQAVEPNPAPVTRAPPKSAPPATPAPNQKPDVAMDSPPSSSPAAFKDCGDCPEMMTLPAASFRMGSNAVPYEKPVHVVTIAKPFAIGVTAVTVAEWNECVANGGCKFKSAGQDGPLERPVTNVGWSDAHEYTAWLSKKTGKAYRLPSEAEWEYAARAGTTTPFYWGGAVGSGNANCADCGPGGGKQTMPVKSYKPNAFGLYEMAGNAAEWIEDCWNPNYKGAPSDGSAWTLGACDQRVLRGGSFDSTSTYIKPSARFRYDADVRYYANGFRLARDSH